MAKSLTQSNTNRDVYFLQAARDSRVHALGAEVRQLTEDSPQVRTIVLYDQPLEDDAASGKCDQVGRVSRQLMANWTPTEEAEYYVCGPMPFMVEVLGILGELGVPESRLHYEFFGPMRSLQSASAVAE